MCVCVRERERERERERDRERERERGFILCFEPSQPVGVVSDRKTDRQTGGEGH